MLEPYKLIGSSLDSLAGHTERTPQSPSTAPVARLRQRVFAFVTVTRLFPLNTVSIAVSPTFTGYSQSKVPRLFSNVVLCLSYTKANYIWMPSAMISSEITQTLRGKLLDTVSTNSSNRYTRSYHDNPLIYDSFVEICTLGITRTHTVAPSLRTTTALRLSPR